MSTASSAQLVSDGIATVEWLPRRAIVGLTLEQYHRMIEEGIVPEDSTVELLRGVLVRKDRSVTGEDPMGHSVLHALAIALLSALTTKIDDKHCHLRIQLPVSCPPDGEPEPDAAIVRGMPRDYAQRAVGPDDVLCVVEVAHSSLERDRDEKLPIYASANIPQYLIINLRNDSIEVYSDPDGAAQAYRTKTTLDRSQTLQLRLADEAVLIPVADLLP